MGMEDLSPTDTQIAVAGTASRCALDCAGKPSVWIAQRLGDAGLIGALAPEETGGLGLGLRDALPLSIECAFNDLAFPLVESMVAAAVMLRSDMGSPAALLNGLEIATVAWDGALDMSGKEGEWRLSGVAHHVIGGRYADWIVARVRGDAGEGVALLPTNSTGSSWRAGNDFDPDRPDTDLVLADVPIRDAQIIWDEGKSWSWVNDAGNILRSADIYGGAKASFEAARTYTGERTQFRRHLCANQSVRHLLARDYLGLETVRHSLEYAALLTDNHSSEAAIARDVLCGLAAEVCARAAENAIQLHGAMGFTTDMHLHRRLRRILAASDIRPARVARESLIATLFESWH
jgi:alkylation response protein AidB-like acyl-CoA dehydrogenase